MLAYLTAPSGARAIVEHLGLPSLAWKLAPAQGPLSAALLGPSAPILALNMASLPPMRAGSGRSSLKS